LQERYDEAESLCLRSLEICQQSLAKDHPSLAKSLYVLTEIYLARERYCEAEPLCLKSLEIYKTKLGDAHVETAFSLGTLAKLYSAQKRYGEAESLYLQALASLESCLGQTHRLAQSIDTHFLVMLIEVIQSGRIIELSNHLITQSFLLRSLDFLEQTLVDSNHPILAISFNNLAHFYSKQGLSAEAEALYRRALEFLP
jgi:tetratricopeptide (TPR) repeat protein